MAKENRILNITFDDFIVRFHTTSLQRHIKVLGIFARLHYRDNKSQFLDYLPIVHEYMNHAIEYIPKYKNFVHSIIQDNV